jgi:hypothetical protein
MVEERTRFSKTSPNPGNEKQGMDISLLNPRNSLAFSFEARKSIGPIPMPPPARIAVSQGSGMGKTLPKGAIILIFSPTGIADNELVPGPRT